MGQKKAGFWNTDFLFNVETDWFTSSKDLVIILS
jgi:hypothetical protein